MAYIGKSTPISVEDTVSKSAGGTFGGDVGVTGTLTATSFSGSGLGLTDIIFDTTPQLGGNLDANTKNITNIGNVGIGTTGTDGKLNVVSTAHNNGAIFDSTGTTQLWLRDTDATSNQRNWGFQISGGDFNIIRANDDRASGFVTPIYMQQAPSNSLAINSSGHVGFGHGSPSAPIDVVTNSNVYAAEFRQSNTSNGDGVIIEVGSTASVDYALTVRSDAGNTSVLAAKADAKVGIGTFSPDKTLTVRGTSGDVVQAKIVYAGSDGNRSGLILQNTHTGGREYGLYVGNNSTGAGLGNSFGVMDNTASAYRLIIDSSGNVGIGTTSIPSADSAYLTVGTQDYAISHNGFSKNSYFDGSSYTAVTNSAGKLIQMGDDIVFYHAPTVAAGAAQTLDEVMSIKSATSEPILNVTGAGYGYTHGAMALKSDTGYDARVRGQGIFLFNEENDTTWYAGTPYLNTTAGNRPFDFNFQSGTTSLSPITATGTGTYTATRIHASGVISTPAGIELGSGVDATAANTLDDYEEGTFTATAGNSVTLYANYDLLHYTKVGRLVTITGQVRVENSNGSAGFRISNFPFTHVGNTEGEGHTFGAVRLYNWTIPSGGYYIGCFMAPGSTTCYVEYVQNNSYTAELPSDAGAYIMFGYTYTAA
tara:strand:- start:3271 stop:5217 length:1947 start_codon:yes stop_codon:yes gene_type:complete